MKIYDPYPIQNFQMFNPKYSKTKKSDWISEKLDRIFMDTPRVHLDVWWMNFIAIANIFFYMNLAGQLYLRLDTSQLKDIPPPHFFYHIVLSLNFDP